MLTQPSAFDFPTRLLFPQGAWSLPASIKKPNDCMVRWAGESLCLEISAVESLRQRPYILGGEALLGKFLGQGQRILHAIDKHDAV